MLAAVLITAAMLSNSMDAFREYDMKAREREKLYLPVVCKAFVAEGLPPELGAAIVRQESNWDPDATVLTGGDGRRGGAYGLCQMTLKTAGGLDRGATPARLMSPEYNCKLAAKLCRENWDRAKGRLVDVLSRYNSGKDFFHAPETTKLVYVPGVTRFMAEYKEQCAQYIAHK